MSEDFSFENALAQASSEEELDGQGGVATPHYVDEVDAPAAVLDDIEGSDFEDEEEKLDDPMEEFRAKLRLAPGDWYVVHS